MCTGMWCLKTSCLRCPLMPGDAWLGSDSQFPPTSYPQTQDSEFLFFWSVTVTICHETCFSSYLILLLFSFLIFHTRIPATFPLFHDRDLKWFEGGVFINYICPRARIYADNSGIHFNYFLTQNIYIFFYILLSWTVSVMYWLLNNLNVFQPVCLASHFSCFSPQCNQAIYDFSSADVFWVFFPLFWAFNTLRRCSQKMSFCTRNAQLLFVWCIKSRYLPLRVVVLL